MFPELAVVYHENYGRESSFWDIIVLINNLFREDKFFSDK